MIGFSDTAAKSWNSRDLDGFLPANRPQKEAVHLEHNLAHTESFVRKEGQFKFEGLKMKAKMENWRLGKISKNNGISAMHHFCFEKWLQERFVCCHIPCFCPWCVQKSSHSTSTVYLGSRNESCL